MEQQRQVALILIVVLTALISLVQGTIVVQTATNGSQYSYVHADLLPFYYAKISPWSNPHGYNVGQDSDSFLVPVLFASPSVKNCNLDWTLIPAAPNSTLLLWSDLQAAGCFRYTDAIETLQEARPSLLVLVGVRALYPGKIGNHGEPFGDEWITNPFMDSLIEPTAAPWTVVDLTTGNQLKSLTAGNTVVLISATPSQGVWSTLYGSDGFAAFRWIAFSGYVLMGLWVVLQVIYVVTRRKDVLKQPWKSALFVMCFLTAFFRAFEFAFDPYAAFGRWTAETRIVVFFIATIFSFSSVLCMIWTWSEIVEKNNASLGKESMVTAFTVRIWLGVISLIYIIGVIVEDVYQANISEFGSALSYAGYGLIGFATISILIPAIVYASAILNLIQGVIRNRQSMKLQTDSVSRQHELLRRMTIVLVLVLLNQFVGIVITIIESLKENGSDSPAFFIGTNVAIEIILLLDLIAVVVIVAVNPLVPILLILAPHLLSFFGLSVSDSSNSETEKDARATKTNLLSVSHSDDMALPVQLQLFSETAAQI